MRTPTALLAAAASIAVAAILAAASEPPRPSTWATTTSSGSRCPDRQRDQGPRVTFRFIGRRPHTASVKTGPSRFSSPTRRSGSYRSPALRKGTYVIYCKIHGQRDQSMKLTVK